MPTTRNNRRFGIVPVQGVPNGAEYHVKVWDPGWDRPRKPGERWIRPRKGTMEPNFADRIWFDGRYCHAKGVVFGLPDLFEFDGTIVDFDVSQNARFFVDGEPATSAHNEYEVKIRPSNIQSNLHGAEYDFVATESVKAKTDIEPHDNVGLKRAHGEVYSAPDYYTAQGGLLIRKMPNDAEVEVNGQTLNKKIVIRGQGGPKEHYRLVTSGPIAAKAGQRELDDWIATAGARGTKYGEEGTGGYVTGFISRDFHDVYFFNGKVQSFHSTFNADYNVIRNFRRWV